MDLKEELLEEYKDCKGTLESGVYDYGTDEYKHWARKKDQLLDRLVQLEEAESRVKQEEIKAETARREGKCNRRHERMLADDNAKRKYEFDYDIEQKRLDNMLEVERLKRQETTSRLAVEWAKVLVPAIVPIVAYNVFQKRMLKFEETGRICSTAGRELHLPKFHK